MTSDIPPSVPGQEAPPSRPWLAGTDRILFGGDYNPEQWPREVWVEDVRLMREAGVNLVTIGVFSWALLEPREGEFDFAWLDEVIELLHDNAIGVDLATPTASPPAWFWRRYPEARPVTRSGVQLGFGSRGIAAPTSPEYAVASARITTELGRRYGRHPAVRLWHVHNEYGAPLTEDFSASAVAAFRTWLVERYGTLESLNAAWGTTFWGQRYGEWDEVDAPRETATTVNPAQRLDFARFSDAALRACFIRERDILHELSPGVPVTTNFMATNCPSVDYWRWAAEVDIVSNDHYLAGEREDGHVMLAMDADLTRSLAGGHPWILMEHSTSAVNWQPRNIAKAPGQLRRNSLAHLARGADGILYFQWRAARFGAEKLHSAMVPHGGPATRVFREVAELGDEIGRARAIRGSRVHSRVAILWDWESNWALESPWLPTVDLSARRMVEAVYSRLWHDGVTVDFAHPTADLDAYDLVIAPGVYLLTEAAAANLARWVERGGVFVATYFTGIVDEHDTVPPGASPGYLRDLLGLRIPEFRPLRAGEEVSVSNGAVGRVWTDDIELTSAVAIATYRSGPSLGGPAITRNAVGSGSAWYLSTEFDLDDLAVALAGAFEDSSILPAPTAGVETVVRSGVGSEWIVRINHSDRAVEVPGAGEVLVGEAGSIAAGGVQIVQRQTSARHAASSG